MKNDKKSRPAKECLADFFKEHGPSPVLEKFVQVDQVTLIRWQKTDQLPVGATAILVYYFLEFVGFSVSELDALDRNLHKVGQYIALGIFSIEKILQDIQASPNTFYRYFYLKDSTKPSIGRKVIFEMMVADKKALLPALIARKQHEIKSELDAEATCKDSTVSVKKDLNADLIDQFESACLKIIELGTVLLAGPADLRHRMRNKIGVGSAPVLHRAWETTNKLLREVKEVKEGKK